MSIKKQKCPICKDDLVLNEDGNMICLICGYDGD